MSGRRKKGHAEEHHADERWLVSYADMITVLMALFIVLYAMSTVDQKKYDELKNSLATGFGVTKTEKLDANKGVVPPKYVHKGGAGFSATTLTSDQVAKEIKKALAAAGVGGKAQVKAGDKTVTISLVGSRAYFGGNSADLRPETIHVLKAITPTLKETQSRVTVEGHADPHGSAGAFGSDWALAGARSITVLEWLVDHHAVDSSSISASSYGSEQAVKGTSAHAIEKNRRVDIVLHAQQTASAASTETETASEKTSSTEGASSHESAEAETSAHH